MSKNLAKVSNNLTLNTKNTKYMATKNLVALDLVMGVKKFDTLHNHLTFRAIYTIIVVKKGRVVWN